MNVAQNTVQTLFVAWQDPPSHRYYPVGRLMSGVGDEHAEYEFAYLRGAVEAMEVGFKPFLAFPDLNRVYRSREMFPFFANRVMSRDRGDYAADVARLGLDPATTDDMTILARSGGVRATDSIEVFQRLGPATIQQLSGGIRDTDAIEVFSAPQPDPQQGCYQTLFLAHGLRYLPTISRERVDRLTPGEPLLIMADCQNPADSYALALRTDDDRMIVGYLPRYLLPDAWHLIQECGYIEVRVEQVNPAPAPLQQRLLCCLEACWPDEFIPFSTDTYQPIAAEASRTPAPADLSGGI